jgi:hypothetical protein
MTLVLVVLALIYVACRLRARPSTVLDGGDLETEDPCPEYADEQLWSWGFATRAQFRAAEVAHFEQSGYADPGVSDQEWRTYHGLPQRQDAPRTRGTTRVRLPLRRASRSRRAPRRARPSRRARPATRAAADPDPARACRGLPDLLQEGGRP